MEGEALSTVRSSSSLLMRPIAPAAQSKYQTSLIEHNKTLAEMSRELSQLRESHNIYKAKLRDMELDNDELENAER